jgi:hypothetical protein
LVLRCLAIAALNARKPPNIGNNDVLQWGPTHVYCIRSLNDIVSLPMDNQGTVVVLDLYGC